MEVADEDIRRELWKGMLPVVFHLTSNEIITFNPPVPFYVRIRIINPSYLYNNNIIFSPNKAFFYSILYLLFSSL